MAVELKVPSLGESLSEVMIGTWYKKEGDIVARDEAVVEIETDKTTVELPAPVPGVITKILKQQGDVAEVGEVVGYMEEQGTGSAPPAAASEPEPAAKPEPVAKPEPAAKPESEAAPAAKPAPAPKVEEAPVVTPPPAAAPEVPSAPAAPEGEGARVMPAAQRLMQQHGVSASEVEASGPGGRILKEDVIRHVEARPAADAPAGPPAAQPAAPHAPSEPGRQEEIVPMTFLRRKIAERLVQAQQTAAILTTFNEVDMSPVMGLRKRYQPQFLDKFGIKLGFMSFFVKAAVDALRLVPEVNAEVRGTDIVYRNYMDVGVAVGGGRGLVVPVIRNAERLSFAEIELKIADYAGRAKNNTLQLEELQGGTFTVSNGGIYGSMMSTPILNPPQTGILGMHAIKDRPVVVDGEIVVRPMMYIALSYDHRLIDGREAVTFLKRIKECIEEPTRVLLEV